MYISVFLCGQGRREIIFRRWEEKPLQVLVGKKNSNAVNGGGSVVQMF